MRQSAVSFKAKGLNFEGIVAMPDNAGSPVPGVVLCHPHPLFGGNMDNNVILAAAFALADQGLAAVRFNFRGVGSSEGQHSKGEQEHQEILGALELLKAWPGVDGKRLGLAGYSFGASVILGSAAVQKKARAIALISPPLRAFPDSPLKKAKIPTMILSGDRDKLVQSAELPAPLESFARPPQLQIVSGADHYWGRMERLAAGPAADFLAAQLK